MPEWNSAGYDMSPGDRCLYLFHDAAASMVKLGLVLDPSRVDQRLRQVSVSKRYPRPGLSCVARTPLPDVTHPVAEHIEAVARHWLCNAHGFQHAGYVDWLTVPTDPPADWQELLNDAVQAATTFGRPS